MTEKQEGLCFFGLFIGFVISLILCGKFHTHIPILIMLLFVIIFGIYIFKTYGIINLDLIKRNLSKSYKLLPEEVQLWENIKQKANNGLIECQCEYGDNATPWVQKLTDEELKLLNHIHDYFYGENWYVIDPLGPKQVQYIMYDDIKNKVKK